MADNDLTIPEANKEAEPLSSRIRKIAAEFDGNAERLLGALIESQRESGIEEPVIALLPLSEIQHAIQPSHEFPARWRFAYSYGELSQSEARLTGQIYVSTSLDTFERLLSNGTILTTSQAALRNEIDYRIFDRHKPRLICLADTIDTDIAYRAFAEKAFESGEFRDRPGRDWAQFLLHCMVQFGPAALLELRQIRYPWESAPASQSVFATDVRRRAADAQHDPTTALLTILSR